MIGRAARMGAFDAVQATWNLHGARPDALADAHGRGMGHRRRRWPAAG
jgi:hypothetical protein